MKFTIVGAGALGTIIGAHLSEAGHPVTLVARGGRAETLRRDGMRVRGLVDRSLHCEVVDDPSTLGDPDVLILGVKTHQMAEALRGLGHVKAGSVFSVANGVMKNEELARVFGAERVMGCMADTSGQLHADGTVEFTRNVSLNIGAYQQPTLSQPESVADAIHAAGVVTRAVDDIACIEWSKFVAWLPMFVISVVVRRTSGACLSNPELARAAALMVKESGAVADRLGIGLSDAAPLPVLSILGCGDDEGADKIREVGLTFLRDAPSHRMSALQDLEAGRRLEVDGTLGFLVRKARELDVAVPNLEAAHRLISGIDELQADERP